MWKRYMETLVSEALTLDPSTSLVFLGDSITESFVGTSFGMASNRTEGIPQVVEGALKDASKGISPDEMREISSVSLGISGDQTQHLLYLLAQCGLPERLGGGAGSAATPLLYHVLIGTNNIGAGMSSNSTLMGILAVAESLSEAAALERKQQERERAPRHYKVLLSTLLPRNDHRASQASVASVNEKLRKAPLPKSVLLLDCAPKLFATNPSDPEADWVVNGSLMPDLLHPNAEGVKLWFDRCLVPAIVEGLL
jgi:lysophospholipase L1-like esterase